MCASRFWRCGRIRLARQNTTCVCRRFASDIFSFFPVRHCRAKGAKRRLQLKAPAIHAVVRHFKRFPPSVCLLELRMDHRQRRPKDAVLRTAMSGGDESETVAWHSSGAKARRENEFTYPPLEGEVKRNASR